MISKLVALKIDFLKQGGHDGLIRIRYHIIWTQNSLDLADFPLACTIMAFTITLQYYNEDMEF